MLINFLLTDILLFLSTFSADNVISFPIIMINFHLSSIFLSSFFFTDNLINFRDSLSAIVEGADGESWYASPGKKNINIFLN